MKDITIELQHRLLDIQGRIAFTRKELGRLLNLESSIKVLLENEPQGTKQETTQGLVPATETGYHTNGHGLYPQNTQSRGKKEKGRSEIAQFLIRVLEKGPLSVRDLKAEAQAEGLLLESKYPSRSVHFCLVGMKKGKLVEKEGKLWKLAEKAQTTPETEKSHEPSNDTSSKS
jgi:hypothetical protein